MPYTETILSFSQGYRHNSEDTRRGLESAGEWLNLRVTSDGYFIPRLGSITKNNTLTAPAETLFKAYFLVPTAGDHKPLFVVSDSFQYSLNDGVTLNSFVPPVSVPGGNRRFGHAQFQGLVFAGNGQTQQFAINIASSPPILYNFYIEQPPDPTVVRIAGGSIDSGRHYYRVLYVREESGVPVAFSIPSPNPIPIDTIAGQQTAQVSGIVDPSDFQLQGVFGFKYIYRTLVNPPSEPLAPYYYVTKIAVGGGTTFNDSSSDATLVAAAPGILLNRGLMLRSYRPNWKHIVVNAFRTHVAELDSDSIFISQFDGVSELYIRNFTHFITVGDGSQRITGLKGLSENFIAIYFTDRIHLLKIDPLVENYSEQRTSSHIGCVAPRSIVLIAGIQYFFGSDKRIYRFNGERVQWISADVQTELNRIPDIRVDQPVAAYCDGLYLFAYPISNGPNTHILVYDPNLNRWFRDPYPVNDMFCFRRTADIGDDTGQLFVADTSNRIVHLYTGTDDDGISIPCTWRSNARPLLDNTPIQRIAVRTGTSGQLNVTVNLNGRLYTDTLSPSGIDDPFGQTAGFNGANGETLQVELSGNPLPEIRGILINPHITK